MQLAYSCTLPRLPALQADGVPTRFQYNVQLQRCRDWREAAALLGEAAAASVALEEKTVAWARSKWPRAFPAKG